MERSVQWSQENINYTHGSKLPFSSGFSRHHIPFFWSGDNNLGGSNLGLGHLHVTYSSQHNSSTESMENIPVNSLTSIDNQRKRFPSLRTISAASAFMGALWHEFSGGRCRGCGISATYTYIILKASRSIVLRSSVPDARERCCSITRRMVNIATSVFPWLAKLVDAITGRNSRLHTAPVGARTYVWIYELDGELRLTAYQHILIATVGSRINNRLYPVERWISLLNWKKSQGILRPPLCLELRDLLENTLSQEGLVQQLESGVLLTWVELVVQEVQWLLHIPVGVWANIQKHYAVRTDFKMFPLSPQR